MTRLTCLLLLACLLAGCAVVVRPLPRPGGKGHCQPDKDQPCRPDHRR